MVTFHSGTRMHSANMSNTKYRSLVFIVTLMVCQTNCQPSDKESLSSEMEVGLSLEEISTEDELGISLCESQSSMSDDEQYSPQYHFGNTLSVILPEREPVDEVPCSNELTIESNIDFGPSRDREKHSSTEDELGISLESSSSDELGISLDDMSDYPDDCFNAQTSFQAADVMDYETVRAKIRPPNHVNHFLPSEVSSGKRMKSKALSLLSIKSALSEKCLCGKQCIKKVTFKSVRELRQSFWTNSRTVRMQLLKYYISHSTTSGKFKYIPISSNLQVCSKAFLIIYRVNKNTFSRAIDMDRRDVASLPGKKPRDSSEKTLILINWLEDYGTYHGDRMPDSGDVLLPYRTKKTSLFEKYKLESAQWSYQAVSRTQFYKTWDTYFPHMKIKKTNSFSKCTTCMTLERQLEKTTCVETRTRFRQLKEEHNERQMMERKYYYGKREASRKNPASFLSLIVDGMDQSKTNLPHFTGRKPKSINGADLLKTHITGVINHGHGGFHTYVDVNEYPHDPNLTINIILKTLKRTAQMHENTLPPVCYIQADNCARENKNRYVLAFCELLVAEKIFNEVHLSFLYVGHTHEDVDAAFSKISEKLRTTDAETLDDLIALLPKPEEILHMFDVKNWLAPHIADIEKHSEPLHFKFVKKNEEVQVFFKGQNIDPWCELNGNILTSIPNGQPTTIKPDYSHINIERQSKQIECLHSLFRKRGTISKWERFFNVLQTTGRISAANQPWFLDCLPRQSQNVNFEDVIPPEVRELILKETKVPKFRIRKRQSKNKEARQTTKKTNKANQRPKQHKSLVKTSTTFLIIPLTDDIKKHVWLMIFIDLLLTCIMMILVCLIILRLFRLLCLLEVLYELNFLFSCLISVHVGSTASYAHQELLNNVVNCESILVC